MKSRHGFGVSAFIIALVAVVPAAAYVGSPVVKRSVTIQLPGQVFYFAPPPAAPPVAVVTGTDVLFTTETSAYTQVSVQWLKNGKPVATGASLALPATTATDAGIYGAKVTGTLPDGRTTTYSSEEAALLVTTDSQRLLNTSTRVRVDATQPVVLHGFVIEPCPSPLLLLVRAVGPTLASYGVPNPLADPVLRVVDASGREQKPNATDFPMVGVLPTLEEATRRVGAFPLPAGTRDVAMLYFLPSGAAYTAQLSSASGGSGAALLEVYAVPL